MKMLAVAVVAIVVVAVTTLVSKGAEAPARPPGVSAQEWIPISDRMGFVIMSRSSVPDVPPPQGPELMPPIEGYFMLKGSMGWSRIVIVEPVKGPGTAG
jgi:hypothetical protein